MADDVTADIRSDIKEIREVVLASTDSLRRMERRMAEITLDIDGTLKAEFLAVRAHLEKRVDDSFTALDNRFDERIARFDELLAKLDK